jgi:hypothetical protein
VLFEVGGIGALIGIAFVGVLVVSVWAGVASGRIASHSNPWIGWPLLVGIASFVAWWALVIAASD